MAVVIERDSVQYFEFTIGKAKTVHKIPLAACLPYPFMRRVMTVDGDKSFALELLHEFCPELEKDEKLSFATIMAIYNAWNEASANDGISSGE